MIEYILKEMNRYHWDGTGCGTNGVNACVYCFGPSPMSLYELIELILKLESDWNQTESGGKTGKHGY